MFAGRLGSLQSSLLHLRDFKDGLYMPYLSEYYNWIVFDSMVLPQERLNATYQAFFGDPIPKSTLKPMMGFFASRGARSVKEALSGPVGQRPTTLAIARQTDIKTLTGAGVCRSRLAMTLFNPSSAVTEYVTRIEVSPGTLISGLSLTIGKENVAGQLFEKRAATWVYQKTARISFVNFETRTFQGGGLIGVDELSGLPPIQQHAGPFRGGFLPLRAIKEVLWQHHLEMAAGKQAALGGFPQIVVLRGSSQQISPDQNLPEFSRLLPDMPGYWTLGPDAQRPDFTDFNGDPQEAEQLPVTIYQAGGARFAAAAGRAVAYSSVEPASPVPSTIEVFEPATGKFSALPGEVAGNGPHDYARALEPWNLELARIFEPSKNRGNEPLRRLIALSRSTGILVPSLAYMVVEDTAQWKMLERTEKKTLKGHKALGLSETTPEPGTIGLLLTGIAVVFVAVRIRKSKALGRS